MHTFINDIVTEIQSNIRLFADDTSLYIVVHDPIATAETLNSDLEFIHRWSKLWLVTFNPSKTETMTFSRKHNKPIHPNLYFDDTVLEPVTEHKHLGILLSEDCKWKSQINSCLNKAWQRIGMLRALKYVLSRSSLERIYISFIRPLLEYGDVVWDNCTQQQKSDVESVQTEAARIITGATKYCSIDKLYQEIDIERLENRRKMHKLQLLYKMKHNLTPSYLTGLIPQPVQTRYNLRNPDQIPLIHCNTQLYRDSFLPSTIRDWNALSSSSKNSTTYRSFKGSLLRPRTTCKPFYNVGNRQGQILHTRLRLGCSSLNYDLHRRSLVESPLCSCGLQETVSHYLLACNKYQHLRNRFLSDLACPVTLNNLLYGDERLSYDQNVSIFLKVQKYIVATKRF